MAHLQLTLFGPPTLLRDGAAQSIETRKAWALLAYLAVAGGMQRRETLATLLWPESDHTQGRANLRNLLWLLNRALGEGWLVIERDGVALPERPGLWVDCRAFEALLREAGDASSLSTLSEAIALYRDDFLAGLTLSDSEAWDEWQRNQTENFRHQFVGALKALISLHVGRGAWESAIPYARRWLAADPLNESAHRQLMRLYSWVGERAAALQQYRQCVRLLDEELGVAPLDESTRLYEAILAGDAPLPPTSRADAATDPEPLAPTRPAVLPLVGRTREWQTLQERYGAVGERGHLVLLEGEAGIGKTRLAEELLAAARARGAVTLTGRAYEGESPLSYGLISDALRGALALPGADGALAGLPPHHLAEVARLLPEVASRTPELARAPALDRPGAQGRFFEGIAEALAALSRGPAPAILFLDDLHWADSASLDLLSYLARRLARWPLFVLITWRGEQVAERDRLRLLVAEGQRAGDATQLMLARLDGAAVGDLVLAAAADAAPPGGLAARLFEESAGLPYFVTEYLGALAGGTIDPEAQRWLLPMGVRDLLQARLSTVSETALQLLATAAAVGRPAEFGLLQQASGRSEEEAVSAVEALQRAGILLEAGGEGEPTYAFSHEKLRELVYEQTGGARRRLLHGRVAKGLVQRAASAAGASLIAHHYQLAGESGLAAEHYLRAGAHARALYANADALVHFEAALTLGHPERAALHEAIGDMQLLLGAYGDALASYRAAIARSEGERRAAATQKLGQLYARRGEWALAAEQFAIALDDSHGESDRAQLYADMSLAASRLGEVERARALAATSLERSVAAGTARGQAVAHHILGILARGEGDLARARHHLEASLAMLEEADDPIGRVAALNSLALLSQAAGEPERALEQARAALALCVAQGDRHREAALHSNVADLLHATGDSDGAMRHLKASARLYAEIGRDAEAWEPEVWKLSEW